jgi:thiamine-monophosphate kinase
MMNEKEIIQLILDASPRHSGHINDFFASDSEILDVNGKHLLLTIDSFSAEDHFRCDDAFRLGGNLAACTVSDIFACGGRVLHVAHSITIATDWSAEFIRMLAQGIADVVRACDGCFAGGDLGRGASWSYTGVAIGEADRIVTRKGAQSGDGLFVSGPIGAGNFEAAHELAPASEAGRRLFAGHRVSFPLRNIEARLVGRHAGACIDTSDGLLNALWTLSEINGSGFSIESVPWHNPGKALLEALDLPVELLMAGECGEYELLCSVPQHAEKAFLLDASNAGVRFHRIGTVRDADTMQYSKNGRDIDVRDFGIGARQYDDHAQYLHALTSYFTERMA